MTTTKKKPTPAASADKLNLRQYWDEVGTENIEKIIADMQKDAGCKTSMAYFRLLRYGFKKAGPKTATRIIELANKHTPGFAPDFELLIRGVPRAEGGNGPKRRIQPSARFLAAQGAKA
jgi:hypothetical protein